MSRHRYGRERIAGGIISDCLGRVVGLPLLLARVEHRRVDKTRVGRVSGGTAADLLKDRLEGNIHQLPAGKWGQLQSGSAELESQKKKRSFPAAGREARKHATAGPGWH